MPFRVGRDLHRSRFLARRVQTLPTHTTPAHQITTFFFFLLGCCLPLFPFLLSSLFLSNKEERAQTTHIHTHPLLFSFLFSFCFPLIHTHTLSLSVSVTTRAQSLLVRSGFLFSCNGGESMPRRRQPSLKPISGKMSKEELSKRLEVSWPVCSL